MDPTSPCVLVVDDDDVTLDTYTMAFRLEGITAVRATCLREARDLIGATAIDFVISDLVLPDGDGVDLLRFTRAGGSTVPFVVITGFASTTSNVEAIRLGALAYLVKPVWAEDLTALVKERLATASALHAAGVQGLAARARAIIATEFSNPAVRPRAIASTLGVSPEHLSRAFTAVYGASLGTVLRDTRLDEAARLLDRSPILVKEVAYASGYRRVAQFTRDYRVRFGRPPSHRGPTTRD